MSKSINIGRQRVMMVLLVAVAMAAAAVPSVASADFGLQPGSFQANILDSSGAVVLSPQAGAHPFAQQVKFDFNTMPSGTIPGAGPDPSPDGNFNTSITELPAGFVGNPQAVPQCEQADFPPAITLGPSRCATSAQVGVASVTLGFGPGYPYPPYMFPVYNLVPPKGVVARFGLVPTVPIAIDITVRTGGDYGITATSRGAGQYVGIYAVDLTLWGVPADPRHDAERFRSGTGAPGDANGQPLSAGLPLTPFLTNPAQCDTPLTTGLSVDSWQNPGKFLSYTSTPTLYTGCDRLTLNASLDVSPTSAGAGEPTGVAVDLNVDQPQAPDALGSPPLKKVSVTLPEGVTVSPSSADGLGACSAAQIGLNNADDPTCPDSAKIGTVQVDTPALPKPLLGSVYLAEPNGGNPFNSLVAMYIVGKASGVLVKLAGEVTLDPKTGRLTSTFTNLPQFPVSKLHVAFKGGPRAALSQAITCGPKTTSATLTSWAGQTINIAGSYNVGPGAGSPNCGPQGFAPQLRAGSVSSKAGASTPFSFQLTRSDADQQLSSVTTVLPEGLLANIKDVTVCQEPAATLGTCGPESLIGHVSSGAGAGPSPFYIDNGRAYLTVGHDGAPFGLTIVVRAVAGPFDLGDVIVHGLLRIDPVTARATVTTEAFPTILQGIPLQLRDVQLTVDRPGFMLNPTSCAAQSIDATIVSTLGTKYATSVPYQATDCATLPLKPKLSLTLTGKGQTTDNKHPGIVAHLTQQSTESRLSKVAVTLPLALALDPDNAQALCKPEQALAKTCPATSIVGQVKAMSVLHQPLSGPVYFVEGIRIDPKSGRKIKTLPKLFIPLKGEGVEVDLNASSEVDPLDHLVTTFADIPDAPVSSVDLTITGGAHGILVVSGTDVCKATQVAKARMDGQNGKLADSNVVLGTPCTPSVISSKTTKSSLTVKLGGLSSGKVTVSGSGIKKTSRTLTSASVATVVAKRTGGSAPTKITVRFDPTGPAKATTHTLALKKSSASKAKR